MNKEIINRLKSTETVDELKDLAAKNGYALADEEANRYFDLFHAKGKVADNELDNVSGGACSLTRNGRFYSGDGDHWLIVTWGNNCELYAEGHDGGVGKNCFHCGHGTFDGFIYYCKVRTYNDDPLNPATLPTK